LLLFASLSAFLFVGFGLVPSVAAATNYYYVGSGSDPNTYPTCSTAGTINTRVASGSSMIVFIWTDLYAPGWFDSVSAMVHIFRVSDKAHVAYGGFQSTSRAYGFFYSTSWTVTQDTSYEVRIDVEYRDPWTFLYRGAFCRGSLNVDVI